MAIVASLLNRYQSGAKFLDFLSSPMRERRGECWEWLATELPGAFYLVVSILSSGISILASHCRVTDPYLGDTLSHPSWRFLGHTSVSGSMNRDASLLEIPHPRYFVLFFSPRAFVAITQTIREDAIPLAGRPKVAILATFYREGFRSARSQHFKCQSRYFAFAGGNLESKTLQGCKKKRHLL